MASLSNYLANAVYNHVYRNIAFTSPTLVWAALYTSDPTPSDVGVEVTGGSYARQSLTYAAPSSGSGANTNSASFTNLPATTFAFIGLRDASTAGNLLVYTPILSVTVLAGGGFTIAAGDLLARLM